MLERLSILDKKKIIAFASLAFFWSLIDDAPVNFDSVYTWPEVTNGLHHDIMEIVLHALTLFFLYLTIHEALKGTNPSETRVVKAYFLTFVAFILSYTQNIPLDMIQDIVTKYWYQLDVVEHILAAIFLYAAIRIASRKEVLMPVATRNTK